MKKLLSIVIAVMMCCTVTVTAFAATPDEAPAKDMQAIIKQEMLDNYYTDVKPAKLEIRIVGGNENGSVYFEHTDDLNYPYVSYNTRQLGKYTYMYSTDDELLVYNDGKIYTLVSAYTNGIISDQDVSDIAKWRHSFYIEETLPNPTSATSATKPVSTKDTATKNTPSNSQNNNGAVQTGQNSVAIFLAVAMLVGCGVIFAKRRNHFE